MAAPHATLDMRSAKEKEEADRRMLWLVEDDCADAESAPWWGHKVDWIFTFACAAYNLVRMRNLAAAISGL